MEDLLDRLPERNAQTRSVTEPAPRDSFDVLVDGGFEAGQAPGPATGYSGTSGPWNWTTSDGLLNPIWTDPPSQGRDPTPRTGAWCVYFNPFGPSTNSISQQVAIPIVDPAYPSGVTATLSFWLKVGTFETTSEAVDTLSVTLTDTAGAVTTIASYSNLSAAGSSSYVQRSFDVSAFQGRIVTVRFASYNDSTNPTVFLLDDVSLLMTTEDPPCGDGTTLCVGNDRFQVQAVWQDYSGRYGYGVARSLTADTGYFWFFTPTNVEVMIKVLDFCSGENPTYAIYAAGLTDVEVTLVVTDTNSWVTKHYRNPLGTPFALIRDSAFACSTPRD
jgi:hypothetical protein